MKDGNLVYFPKVAYDEMIKSAENAGIPSTYVPGAMVALASVDSIYFASSIRAGTSNVEIAGGVYKTIMKDYMQKCARRRAGISQTWWKVRRAERFRALLFAPGKKAASSRR